MGATTWDGRQSGHVDSSYYTHCILKGVGNAEHELLVGSNARRVPAVRDVVRVRVAAVIGIHLLLTVVLVVIFAAAGFSGLFVGVLEEDAHRLHSMQLQT